MPEVVSEELAFEYRLSDFRDYALNYYTMLFPHEKKTNLKDVPEKN